MVHPYLGQFVGRKHGVGYVCNLAELSACQRIGKVSPGETIRDFYRLLFQS